MTMAMYCRFLSWPAIVLAAIVSLPLDAGEITVDNHKVIYELAADKKTVLGLFLDPGKDSAKDLATLVYGDQNAGLIAPGPTYTFVRGQLVTLQLDRLSETYRAKVNKKLPKVISIPKPVIDQSVLYAQVRKDFSDEVRTIVKDAIKQPSTGKRGGQQRDDGNGSGGDGADDGKRSTILGRAFADVQVFWLALLSFALALIAMSIVLRGMRRRSPETVIPAAVTLNASPAREPLTPPQFAPTPQPALVPDVTLAVERAIRSMAGTLAAHIKKELEGVIAGEVNELKVLIADRYRHPRMDDVIDDSFSGDGVAHVAQAPVSQLPADGNLGSFVQQDMGQPPAAPEILEMARSLRPASPAADVVPEVSSRSERMFDDAWRRAEERAREEAKVQSRDYLLWFVDGLGATGEDFNQSAKTFKALGRGGPAIVAILDGAFIGVLPAESSLQYLVYPLGRVFKSSPDYRVKFEKLFRWPEGLTQGRLSIRKPAVVRRENLDAAIHTGANSVAGLDNYEVDRGEVEFT